jgi:hypothetical protein
MLGSDFSHWIDLTAASASGGIVVAWRQGLGPVRPSRIDNYSISLQFSSSALQPWWLTCLYGPQGDDNKVLFLQELRTVEICLPWSMDSARRL